MERHLLPVLSVLLVTVFVENLKANCSMGCWRLEHKQQLEVEVAEADNRSYSLTQSVPEVVAKRVDLDNLDKAVQAVLEVLEVPADLGVLVVQLLLCLEGPLVQHCLVDLEIPAVLVGREAHRCLAVQDIR